MKHIVFLISVIITTLLAISCEKNKQKEAQTAEKPRNEIQQEETLQIEPIEQSSYSIKNGSIHYEPSEEEWFRKQREAATVDGKTENDVKPPLAFTQNDPDDIFGLKNAVKDFSSYDIHPLEKFAGKWRYLDYYGNKHESESYVEIYKAGSDYKYYYNYHGSIEKGNLLYMPNARIIFASEKISAFSPPKVIIGDLVLSNNSPSFLLASEWPIGYFRLETDADKDFSARPVEYVNGSWIGQYELIDGTPIEKKQFSWGLGFSLPDSSLELDLGRKTLLMPGPGECRIETVFRDEKGSICIEAIPINTEIPGGPINISITFLDYHKAYISHDKWELFKDKRYSPEEKWPWFRLSGPEGD